MHDDVDPSAQAQDPAGRRAHRVAVLLAVALIYTCFSASTQAKEPSQILSAAPGTNYDMTGTVVAGLDQTER